MGARGKENFFQKAFFPPKKALASVSFSAEKQDSRTLCAVVVLECGNFAKKDRNLCKTLDFPLMCNDILIAQEQEDAILMKKIHEFAKLCKTSAKTLRFYDNNGILKANYIDPDNGYRYYTDEQAYQYQKIQQLKQIGFSLEEIKNSLLDCDEQEMLEMLYVKQQALLDAYKSCTELIQIYEQRTAITKNRETQQEQPEKRTVVLHRFDAEQKIILDDGERFIVFRCRKEGMDICSEAFTELFCKPGYMNLSLSDIPQSHGTEQDMLIKKIELEPEDILHLPEIHLLSEEDHAKKLSTVMLAIALPQTQNTETILSLDTVDSIVGNIVSHCAEDTCILWGVSFDTSKANNSCVIQIIGIWDDTADEI